MKKRITKISSILLSLMLVFACTFPTFAMAEGLTNQQEITEISDLLGENNIPLDLGEKTLLGNEEKETHFEEGIQENVQGDPNFTMLNPATDDVSLSGAAITFGTDVTIKNESDLKSLFPDDNFRSVVFAAVSEGKNTAVGTDIIDALGNFTGDISAAGKGITDITGIDLLRKANTVDLSKNEIKDFSKLGTNVSTTDYETWYGATEAEFLALKIDIEDRKSGTNVYWDLNANPIEKLPINFGGRLTIKQAASSSYTYEEDISEHLLYTRPENGEGISGTLNIGKAKIVDGATEKNANITTINEGVLGSHLIDMDYPEGDPPDDKVSFNNLKKSGTGMIGFGCDQQIAYWTTDEWGTNTPGSQSFKYYLLPRFFVYDKVSLVQDHSEEVIFTKYNEDKTKTLQGAQYSLFRIENNTETLIDENATTDANGIIKEHLIPGNYKFVETKAPDGYDLNQEPIMLDIEPFTPGVGANAILGGGRTTLDNLTNGNTVTAETGKIFIAGLNDIKDNSPDVTLSINEAKYEDEIARVNVNYTALDSLGGKGERREFHTLQEAENDINNEKNRTITNGSKTFANSNILGEVKIEVLYTGYGNGTVNVEQTNTLTPLPPIDPPIIPPIDPPIIPPIDPPINPPTDPPSNPPRSPRTTDSQKMDIEVQKIWEDVQGYNGTHPKITIYLLRNNKIIEQVGLKDGKTTYTFKNLPMRDGNGKEYEYEIEEKPVKGYITSIDGYKITNTHEDAPPKPIVPVDPTPPTYPNITPPLDPYESTPTKPYDNPPVDPNITPSTSSYNVAVLNSSGKEDKIGARTNPQTSAQKQSRDIELEFVLGVIIAIMMGTMIVGRKIIRKIEE